MHLHRRIKIQLAVFALIAMLAVSVMTLHFLQLPALLFGVGRYTVTVELPRTGGLYSTGNVTYRGTEVGRVEAVNLTKDGVAAVLSLRSGIDIPSDLRAEVHSQSAIGEQYIALLPRNGSARPLRNGDVVPVAETTVPPDINALLAAANTGLQAIPHDNLKTLIDESNTAVGGLGPELSRIVRGSSDLAIAAHDNLDPFLALVDQAKPVLDSQSNTSSEIKSWATHIASVTSSLQKHDQGVAALIDKGGPAAQTARQLIDRLQPTLPIVLANLVSVGEVGLAYRADLEQLLVLFPQVISATSAGLVANMNSKQAYKGQYLSFNLNINLPPPCTTGFLPAQQQRVPNLVDSPERPAGDLYCRVPQDSQGNVRAVRNTPCETVPGKRAPTVKMCESEENYLPLNDGYNWKGDPNATITGQAIPQLPPGAAAPAHSPPESSPAGAPPIAAAHYDPATGAYVGPDDQLYTQSQLAQTAPKDKTWQSMLTPPKN
ncbi:MCE family protein [Mycobacterium sp. CBMA293]|uniref:MCE family protein n=1 Tax=unclassified Mycolicibacterium TaxID=2636767 RepID=UPI0012DE4500|nr:MULTISPECIES: MlaD family protein [unclassified Mycolicibacterium]MUL46317.1 MCE family protein [Mycolicibacterium sp. CBMA 360]MUL57171.1 MCE family protein [Mycolicibacterium sp. CBMA 335]MUL70211.1 MCE family protein [Mycolicibacterium sp. CBMA 311]MUL92259.1 MCE family protein [Mycolicibacterium sp. CBMA 230]MUM04809.1 mammalian cell entry protein [Mycolicibacterium sp. CBMA 213]